MEDIRAAATAYYANSSIEVKRRARQLFDKIDTDKSGRISTSEFQKYVDEHRSHFNPATFAELDKDGDGFLDFEEAVVFYYMINFRTVRCDVCRTTMKAIYFTCIDCFFAEDSYDLCLTCYGLVKYDHEHSNFLDNYNMLSRTGRILREKGSNNQGSTNNQGNLNNQGSASAVSLNRSTTIKAGVAAAKIGADIALAFASSGAMCTIL